MNSVIRHIRSIVPDSVYLSAVYYRNLHKLPDLRNPKTFNEKLQWLKLHDHNPLYTIIVDKVKVKDYVASIVGKEHIIPAVRVWEKAEDIDFDILPEQFVIKCNHDSHGVIVCKDRNQLDENLVREKLRKRLAGSGFNYGREWPYKNVEKRILAEEYVSDDSGELTDYKVHCFNGVPKFVLVCRNRFESNGLCEDFYDTSWNLMDVKRPDIPHGKPLEQPAELEQMLRMAETLSEGFPFLRTDFYCVKGKVLVGELTLYPASGFLPFVPEQYDELFGSWLNLPEK